MKTSLFEIRATVKKAALGVGFAAGLAEDIGRAAQWLCADGSDGVSAALAAFRGSPKLPVDLEISGGIITVNNAAVGICGPSVIDLFAADKSVTQAKMHNLDAPELMHGLVAVLSADYGINLDITQIGRHMTLTRGAGQSANPLGYKGSVTTKDSVWEQVQTLAARTYVPETKASRMSGAGAGLTDND